MFEQPPSVSLTRLRQLVRRWDGLDCDVKVNRHRDARHPAVQPSRPDGAAARAFANILEPKSAGMPISHADCQIAAIARILGACVATRNDGDFEHCGIEVINPWPAPADPDEAPTEVATGVGFVMLGPGGQNMIAIDRGANAQFSTPTWTGPQARCGPGQPCHHPQSGAGPPRTCRPTICRACR